MQFIMPRCSVMSVPKMVFVLPPFPAGRVLFVLPPFPAGRVLFALATNSKSPAQLLIHVQKDAF